MSASLVSPDWNFRVAGKRLVAVNAKNDSARKVAVIDSITNLPFAAEADENLDLASLQEQKEYFASLEVYTSTNLLGVNKDFIDFFQALDVDQSLEDFIKAYWIYPSKIKFKLTAFESTE